jgi:glycosyltransferase involved in cell wall biosynthesis
LDTNIGIAEQIPENTDIIHFNFLPRDIDKIAKPYVITIHRNYNDYRELNKNSIFVSKNHANRYGSESYVYNGLDWDDYIKPDLKAKREYYHFLGNAAWRVKNVRGAIEIIKKIKKEHLKVLGGYRFNFKMGLRLTLSPRVNFYGIVGGEKKFKILNGSKGLIFPVRWHEPFGLAVIESLYSGCPVFATPYGSLPELVKNDVGYLSNSLNLLANALENNEKYSRKICHEYAVENFNSEIMAKSYLEKYQKVLANEVLNDTLPKLKEIQTVKFLEWID